MCVYVCVCMYECMWVSVYVHMCVKVYIPWFQIRSVCQDRSKCCIYGNYISCMFSEIKISDCNKAYVTEKSFPVCVIFRMESAFKIFLVHACAPLTIFEIKFLKVYPFTQSIKSLYLVSWCKTCIT